jgi:abortive infection bacteriophage resistance protein
MSNQEPRTIQEQFSILKQRGMNFRDESLALSYLSRISYFRLKYYWIDMMKPNSHQFKNGVYFEDVIERYEFDQSLRHLLFLAIEMLEVGLRTKMVTEFSLARHSGLWYLDKTLFDDMHYHEEFIFDLKHEFARSTDPFARDYVRNHPNWNEKRLDGDNPDAWLIFETATFGRMSKMYKNMKSQLPLKSKIAKEFGLYSTKELSSWLEALSVLRNIIAHHSRLWYRIFSKTPTNVQKCRDKWLSAEMNDYQRQHAFGVISCLLYLCNAINPNNKLKENILILFKAHPSIPIYKLGFIDGWEDSPLWKQQGTNLPKLNIV